MKFCASKEFANRFELEPQTRLAMWRKYFNLPVKIYLVRWPHEEVCLCKRRGVEGDLETVVVVVNRFYFSRYGATYFSTTLAEAIDMLTLLLVKENREISQ